ncbi:pre-rRNA-processing protein TSR1 homolog [Crassostrea virginica]
MARSKDYIIVAQLKPCLLTDRSKDYMTVAQLKPWLLTDRSKDYIIVAQLKPWPLTDRSKDYMIVAQLKPCLLTDRSKDYMIGVGEERRMSPTSSVSNLGKITSHLQEKTLQQSRPISCWYIQIHIADVPEEFMTSYKQGLPVVVFGLLSHEHKISVINFLLKRVPEYRPPIKSKDRLIFHVGFRRYSACPVFSQHTNASKHKFERFFAHDMVTMATNFAPISFPPCPVLVFKEQRDGQHELIATGSLHSVNPDRIVTKRIVLSGHPFKINKRSAFVRYMFFNRGGY